MLEYMPLPHRTFLLHLSAHPTPLRPLVVMHAESHPKLAAAYDEALEALKRFREKHMRVVSVFIVQQARRRPSARIRRLLGEPVSPEEEEDEIDGISPPPPTPMIPPPRGELRGTGGTPLFKFLKRCRDNTTGAMIGKPKGPTYELQ
jgi:indoleamine 2,3-dioxygenase